MSDTSLLLGIAVGVTVCVLLLLFIYRKARYIKQVRKQQAEQKAVVEARLRERFIYLSDSLKLLAQAMRDEQVGVVEGAIRISALLKEYDQVLFNDKDYSVFTEISKQTEHIPIKEAWKALDKQTKRRHEFFMAELEGQHGEQAKAAALRLFDYLNQVRH